MKLCKFSAIGALFAFGLASAQTTDYYYNSQITQTVATNSKSWIDADGTTYYVLTAEDNLSFNSNSNWILNDSADATGAASNFAQMNLQAGVTIGDLTNSRTTAGNGWTQGVTWTMFTSSTGTTFTAENIYQHSMVANMQIRTGTRSAGALSALEITVNGVVDVTGGILYFGGNSTTQSTKSIEIKGATTLSNAGKLVIYSDLGASFKGGLTGSSTSSLTAVTGGFSVIGNFSMGDGSSITNTGAFSVENGIDLLSTSKLTLKGTGQTTDTASMKGKLMAGLGTTVSLGTNNGTYGVNSAGKLTSFTATDFDYTNSALISWNLGTFRVKADAAVAGSTGTFSWSTNNGANGSTRARIVTDNFYVDTFNMGAVGDTALNYFEMARGSDVTDKTVGAGTVDIGTLNISAGIMARIGYLYSSAGSFEKYGTISIGTANIATNSGTAEVTELHADTVTIGKLNKTGNQGHVRIGQVANGMGAETITIGSDSSSTHFMNGGKLMLYGKNITLKGTTTFGSASSAAVTGMDVKVTAAKDGTLLNSVVDIENIIVDTSAQTSAFTYGESGKSLTSLDIDSFSSSGANSVSITAYANTVNFGNLNLDSAGAVAINANTATFGTLTLNTPTNTTVLVNAPTATITTLNYKKQGVVNISGSAAIGEINVEGGQATRLKVDGGVAMTGDLNVTGSGTSINLEVGAGEHLTSTGILNVTNKGTVTLNYSTVADRNETQNLTFAGISGGDGTTATHIFVSSSTNSANINSAITLNGSEDYVSTTRIHDFADNAEALPSSASISLTKDGTGTQRLQGANYWRGDTIVKSGELHLRADGADNLLGRGVADVYLEGGKFSAIGATDEIGTVIADSLTWDSTATIIVDINGTSADLIDVGTLTKGAGDVFTFEFALGELGMDSTTVYKLIGFEDTSFLDESVFEGFVSDGSITEFYFAILSDGVYVSLAPIPEPSAYAAILGALALAFALRRRFKRR